ncbi:MAG: hypothetical protein QF463_15295 [Vicinamibacterales bacterium]|jgi:hypothetical protein|nr:hypothetical protein [Acidobacteriota bacterium]MDP6373548.1 hypothetical protein [Vicinamibacterales bacterium]MDP6610429.1 hypothetical protein [Vicinamibacterales bacterium]HAK56032.1 hypothetical protein [Acidobacteriota bacterium]|tara:strand:- start:856 stop:1263 length:408 start_codon:yes stop_codon:yes gene_type:complete
MVKTRRWTIALGLTAAIFAGTTAAQEASTLDVADATGYIGKWALSLETPRGTREQSLTLSDVAGKVSAELSGGRGGAMTITDITKSDRGLVLRFERNMRGNAMDVTMTLSLDGETLNVSQDIGDRTMSGTGEKRM